MAISFKGTEAPAQPIPVRKDNPGFFKKIGAGIVGSLATTPLVSGLTIASGLTLQNQMVKVNRSISGNDVKVLNKAAEKILETSGLKKKGVKIIRDIDLLWMMPRTKGKAKGLSRIMKMLDPCYQIKMGRNACFDFVSNNVLVSNKIALAQFHELGHAMNFHNGGVGKFLQNTRLDVLKQMRMQNVIRKLMGGPAAKIPVVGKIAGLSAMAIGLVAVFKNKKAEGEKPQGVFDTVTTFIKNNVGKLTFLTMLPMVAEEGLASFKGEKAVKGLISKNLFKKIKSSNRLGLATYAIGAVLTSIGAYYASKIRDKIAQPNLNKQV